jgi:hypothetical protein
MNGYRRKTHPLALTLDESGGTHALGQIQQIPSYRESLKQAVNGKWYFPDM